MKRYPAYKDSGVPWLGQVPAHWSIIRYKYVFQEKGTKKESMLQAGAISYGTVVFKDDEMLPPATKATYQEVLKGEFLINPINLNYDLKSLRTALSEIDVCVSPAYIVLRPLADANLRYLKYLIHLFDVCHMKTLGAGVRQTISFEDIGVCGTIVPPKAEQAAIALFLDRAVGEIDSAISYQEQMADLLKERIDSLVLKSSSSKDVAHVRLGYATELISRSIEESPSQSYTKLGLFNRGRGLFHKDDSNHDDMGDSEFFYVRPGDLIISGQFAWEGAVAMAGDTEDGCVVSHRYPVLRGLNGVVETEYLLAFFCTELGTFLLNEHSRGAAGRNRPLNIRSLLKEKIPLPSIELQAHVVEAIKQRQSILGQIAQLNRLLKERRTAIITQAVTGQIDVR